MNPECSVQGFRRTVAPYSVKQTPRGSVVVCGAHMVTDEIKTVEATALAESLNAQHRRTM